MGVERFSVTLPAELGAALRALAEQRGLPISAILAEAVDHQVRLSYLAEALDVADARFGEVDEAAVAEAEAELANAARPRKKVVRK